MEFTGFRGVDLRTILGLYWDRFLPGIHRGRGEENGKYHLQGLGISEISDFRVVRALGFQDSAVWDA